MSNVYAPINSSYKLVFDDEFNGTSLNTNNWISGFWQASDGLSNPVNPSEELQDYSASQISVSGGYLHLTAAPITSTAPNGVTYHYQSGMVQSTDQNFTYGYYEARIYTPPASPGVIANWPAWWLAGAPNDNGEIDIMEGLNGKATSTYHDSTHTSGEGAAAAGDFTGWHVYGVLWTPGELQFYYDGQLQHTVTGVLSPALELILNYAVGGYGGPTVAPATMLVDYVHVYQSTQYDPNAVAVTPQAGYGGPGDTGSSTTTTGTATSGTGTTGTGTTGTGTGTTGTATTGTDTLTLNVSEDAYQGDAQFTVTVDGTQIGGTLTASALHSTADSNVFTLTGDWGQGTHTVKIQFLNDAYGGSTSLDRNLYVNSIAYNGTTYANTTQALDAASTAAFTVGGSTATASAPPDTLTLNLSEDAWNGNAEFVLSIDGKTITTPQAVTALQSAAASESFTYSGNFGAGTHVIGISYVNDAYGGSASQDRNLVINSINYNGVLHSTGTITMWGNGTTHFTV